MQRRSDGDGDPQKRDDHRLLEAEGQLSSEQLVLHAEPLANSSRSWAAECSMSNSPATFALAFLISSARKPPSPTSRQMHSASSSQFDGVNKRPLLRSST